MGAHVVSNFDELATSEARKDALEILEAGYESIRTDALVREQIRLEGAQLYIQERRYDLDSYERVLFVGIGKCAADAGKVFEEVLGARITDGLILDVRGVPMTRLKCVVGTHPLPSECNVETAEDIRDMLQKATSKDLVIAVISGGGSALLCLPHDTGCEKVAEVTKTLMDKGATIGETNIVRKHMSDIQGGQFAKFAYPAKVVSCIFSDVPGDHLETIASGPTILDKSTREDALRIMEKYDIRTDCGLPECQVIETPKEQKFFQRVDTFLCLTNKVALEAMAEAAQERGYVARIESTEISGEARNIGAALAVRARKERGTVLLYGGETTVTVQGAGKGGRNQEVVLGGLSHMDTHTTLLAAASDGWDNSDVAGALGDSQLFAYAQAAGNKTDAYLKKNASYEFFLEHGGHLKTGKTGTNVADLYFTLTTK